jgi:hypothetical protein
MARLGTILTEGLAKAYHTIARQPGAFGAVRSLVAPVCVAKTAVASIGATSGRRSPAGTTGQGFGINDHRTH